MAVALQVNQKKECAENSIDIFMKKGGLQVETPSKEERKILVSLLQPFIKKNKEGILTGSYKRNFLKKWLWIEGDIRVCQSAGVQVQIFSTLPSAKELVAMGVNGVVLSHAKKQEQKLSSHKAIKQWIKECKDFGLSIAVCPLLQNSLFSPELPDFVKNLQEGVQMLFSEFAFDIFVWESLYCTDGYRANGSKSLLVEIMQKELLAAESCGKQLLFLLPDGEGLPKERQSELAMSIAERCGPNSFIGIVGENHLFWEKAESRLAPSFLPVMGVISRPCSQKSALFRAVQGARAEGIGFCFGQSVVNEKNLQHWLWAVAVLQTFSIPLDSPLGVDIDFLLTLRGVG